MFNDIRRSSPECHALFALVHDIQLFQISSVNFLINPSLTVKLIRPLSVLDVNMVLPQKCCDLFDKKNNSGEKAEEVIEDEKEEDLSIAHFYDFCSRRDHNILMEAPF